MNLDCKKALDALVETPAQPRLRRKQVGFEGRSLIDWLRMRQGRLDLNPWLVVGRPGNGFQALPRLNGGGFDLVHRLEERGFPLFRRDLTVSLEQLAEMVHQIRIGEQTSPVRSFRG